MSISFLRFGKCTAVISVNKLPMTFTIPFSLETQKFACLKVPQVSQRFSFSSSFIYDMIELFQKTCLESRNSFFCLTNSALRFLIFFFLMITLAL
jgi:hypothetical protein